LNEFGIEVYFHAFAFLCACGNAKQQKKQDFTILPTKKAPYLMQETPFTVQLNTKDARLVTICQDYWALGVRGRFRYTLTDMGQRYRLKPKELHQIVQKHARVFFSSSRCSLCGSPTHFLERRADYYEVYRRLNEQPWSHPRFLCINCDEEREEWISLRPVSHFIKNRVQLQLFWALRAYAPVVLWQLPVQTLIPNFQKSLLLDFVLCDEKMRPKMVLLHPRKNNDGQKELLRLLAKHKLPACQVPENTVFTSLPEDFLAALKTKFPKK